MYKCPLNRAGGTPSSTLSSTTQSSALMSSYGSVLIPSTQGPEEQLRMEGIQVGQVRPTGVVTGKRGRSVSARGSRNPIGRPPNRPRAAQNDQDIAAYLTQNNEEL